MPFQIQRRFALFDGSSGDSSNFTSAAQFVGDYAYMSVSWATDVATASRLTLEASNEDGFGSSINTWSTVTGITSAGIFTVDPGTRWMRGRRASEESLSIVEMFGRS